MGIKTYIAVNLILMMVFIIIVESLDKHSRLLNNGECYYVFKVDKMKQVFDVLLDTDSEIGIAVLDPQLRVLFMNEKMNTFYPAKEGEVYVEKTRLHQLLQLTVGQNKKIAGFPVHEFIKNQPVHVILSILPFQQDGTTVSLLVMACDMTEIHKSYEPKIRQ